VQPVCNPDSEVCMMEECGECCGKTDNLAPNDVGGEMCSWFEWMNGDEEKV